MTHLADFAEPMLILILIILAIYEIGRWIIPGLRARGYGPTLDALSEWQGRVSL